MQYLLAKLGFDTEEKDPCAILGCCRQPSELTDLEREFRDALVDVGGPEPLEVGGVGAVGLLKAR